MMTSTWTRALGWVSKRPPVGHGVLGNETRNEGKDKIAIVVRDRGDGIPPENLPKIFEPYFTGKRTGTGLGLAITKNIIESLGGTVTAKSSSSDGTEIRVDLFIGN